MQFVLIGHFFVFLLISASSALFAQEMPPAKVVTSPITQEEIAENKAFLGVLYYERTSEISSEVAGLVTAAPVRQGDTVKKGELLLTLDTEILANTIALDKTRIDRAALAIRHTEKNYQRLESLYDQEGISEKDRDDALYQYQDALKEKETLEQELATLLIQERQSKILAPFAGVILEKRIEVGSWAQPGGAFYLLGSSSDLYVKVPIAETLLRFVSMGQELPVWLHAFDRHLVGVVTDFAPIADITTKNIFLKVRIPPQNKVAANMSANVYVPTSAKKTLSIIPRDALIKFQGKDFIYTVKEGKAAILPVHIVTYQEKTIGADDPYLVPSMPVVVEGNERLRPDQPVTVAGEN